MNWRLLISVIATLALLTPKLHAGEKLHISLGDNYGKHAMLIEGKPAGIQKDLLSWFFSEYMQLDVEIEAMPWKRAQALVVKRKRSDGYFTAYTKKRVEELKLVPSSQPFYTTHVKMHTWKGNPNIALLNKLNNIEELLALDHIKHVFLNGHGYHEENFKSAKFINRVMSVEQIPLYLLAYKRADIFVEQSELFYPLAEEAGLTHEIETLENIKFKSLRWHLYIRPDSKHIGLMQPINQALDKAIKEGAMLTKVQEIFTKYGLSYDE